MKLSKTGEFGLIEQLRSRCSGKSGKILRGIGDDTAVINNTGRKTLLTSDMMVEGVHFDLSITTFYQLGHKFLAVNISDILAMGGTPEYFIISIGIPGAFSDKNIKELYSGILKIAKKFGVSIIGGDTCSSDRGLVLSGTLSGSGSKVIYRSGARPGDTVYAAEALGGSAAGLQLLMKRGKRLIKFSPSAPSSRLIKKHLMPLPSPLSSLSGVTSMIDISDGLLIDLSHICDESKAGAVIYEEKIPLSRDLKIIADKLHADPVDLALRGGEDYSLLFTASSPNRTDASPIGTITKKDRIIIGRNGKKKKLKPEGYEHFR